MAKEKSLSDFSFDNDEEFFSTNTKGSNIKEAPSDDDFEEDDEDTEPTKLGADKKTTEKASTDEDEDVDVEPSDDDFDFSPAPKKKEEAKAAPVPKKTVAKAEDKREEDKGEADADDETEDEEEDDETETSDDEGDTTDNHTILATELKEVGVFQYVEIPKDKKLTAEDLYELHNKEIEARIDDAFVAFSEDLDEDGKAFVKYLKNGGKTQDFIKTYRQNSTFIDIKEFDEDNEKLVEKVIKHYAINYMGMDEEEANDNYDALKDNGKAKARAATYYNKINENEKKIKNDIVEKQAAAVEKQQQAAEKFNKSLVELIDKSDAIGAFPLSKTEQKELKDYMTKATVKVGKNNFVPPLQVDIFKALEGKTEEDRKNLVILAKLLKRKFDVSDVVATVQTKVTQKTRSKLNGDKGKQKTINFSGKKQLADYF